MDFLNILTKILGGLQWISGEFLGDLTKLGAEQKFELCKVAERKIYVFPLEFFEATPFRQKPKALTKSSKLIATLGVVAGLGVASLPLGSVFAVGPSVSGNVQLDVEVQPAIAMTISGNNDSGTHKQTGDATSFGAVDVFNDGTNTAGKVDGHTVAASTTTTSSSYTSILPNAKVDGNASNGFGSTVTVYTNNSAGYTLAIRDADSTLDLVNENSDTIPAMVTGSVDPTDDTTIEAGTAAWAYQLQKSDGTDVSSPAYAAITSGDVTIVTRGTETSGGSENYVGYGVSTASDQATGIYKDTIVYTATCQ